MKARNTTQQIIKGIYNRPTLLIALSKLIKLSPYQSKTINQEIGHTPEYLNTVIKNSERYRVIKALKAVMPYLKITNNEERQLLTRVTEHGRQYLTPKQKEQRWWIANYVRIVLAIHHSNLSKASLKIHHHKHYLASYIVGSQLFSIKELVQLIPYLREQAVKEIRNGNYEPITKALKVLHKQVHDRESLLTYLICVARGYNTSLTEISNLNQHSQSYLYETVKNNSKNAIIYACHIIAYTLDINLHTLIQAINQTNIPSSKYHHRSISHIDPQIKHLHLLIFLAIKDIAYQKGYEVNILSDRLFHNRTKIWNVCYNNSLSSGYKLIIKVVEATHLRTDLAQKAERGLRDYFHRKNH